jgi:hypothetical protein
MVSVYIEVPTAETYPTTKKKFLFATTGAEFSLPANHRFLGTLVFFAGKFVLHVYDISND